MLNIVVPMAGLGSRFKDKGFTFPKALIEIRNKPMIQVVVDNLRPDCDHRFIFICQKEHYTKYSLDSLLNLISPNCVIITIESVTAGAACTVLLAKDYIDNDSELLIANSDQYVDMNINDFIATARRSNADGYILTFNSTHPKWSFVRKDNNGNVIEVAEKKPISNEATVGVYYFKKGSDFVKGVEEMIFDDLRVNNEFYVCPVYNQLILSGKIIKTYLIPFEKMYGLGTPEDLAEFLKSDIVRNKKFLE